MVGAEGVAIKNSTSSQQVTETALDHTESPIALCLFRSSSEAIHPGHGDILPWRSEEPFGNY